MKLTFKEKTAIKASLRHWIEDIYLPLCIPRMTAEEILVIKSSEFCSPVKIRRRRFRLIEGGLEIFQLVSDMGSDCPLCQYSKRLTKSVADYFHPCDLCPYVIKYHRSCDDIGIHWDLWHNNPCLQTAIDMITALENLLPESERDGVYL